MQASNKKRLPNVGLSRYPGPTTTLQTLVFYTLCGPDPSAPRGCRIKQLLCLAYSPQQRTAGWTAHCQAVGTPGELPMAAHSDGPVMQEGPVFSLEHQGSLPGGGTTG